MTLVQLQRLGRTGRQRDGYVHVLLAEGREELNMDKAKATYKEVQKTIVRGEQLELYGDVERLLPEHAKPACLERVMDVEPYVREEPRKRLRIVSTEQSPQNGKKRKRNDNISRNIPAGASMGFVSVIDLLEKGKRKERGKERASGSKKSKVMDAIDAEIGAGTGSLRRTVSANESISKTVSERREKKKTRTMETNRPTKNLRRMPSPCEPTSSQCADDSDDLDIGRGLIATRPILEGGTLKARPLNTVVEISSDSDASAHSDGWGVPSPRSNPRSPLICQHGRGCQPQPKTPSRNNREKSMAWLIDGDDDDSDVCIIDSSPSVRPSMTPIPLAVSSEVEIVHPSKSPFMSSLRTCFFRSTYYAVC
jgi:ATP-dependent DNA helicase MPH1